MKTLLICHEGAMLDQEGLARWLASFSELGGIVLLREKSGRKFKRVRREMRRVGGGRFLDVTAFRAYYKMFLAAGDQRWERRKLDELRAAYPPLGDVPTLITHSPNSAEAENFISEQQPDIIIARCKVILNRKIYSQARTGTFVMHPGICPEYRNAHGCFWALATGDTERVGATLLKIDDGVDTGPVYGYYTYPYDSRNESHIVIQTRVVLENLDDLRDKLIEIHNGQAEPLSVAGRASQTWGHPWLSSYLAWKRRAARAGK